MSRPLPLLVVGAGYTGARLAHRLAARGPVVAVCSRPDTARAIRGPAIESLALDLDAPDTPLCATLEGRAFGAVAYLVPPPASGEDDPRLARLLPNVGRPGTRFVYVSTTGVYGNADGGDVDEETSPRPTTPRARRRLAAETRLRAAAAADGFSFTILRVPGIYGPGRLPLERLRRGEAVLDPRDAGVTNRIHVDDLVEALGLCATHPAAADRIYNVTDGSPCSTTIYLETLAQMVGLPPPPRIRRSDAGRHFTPEALSFLDESRRVDSTRIRRELGFVARFADLRDGLRASLPAA